MTPLNLCLTAALAASLCCTASNAQPSPRGAPNNAQALPPSTPPWQAATPWPDRVVVTLAGDPKSSFSVTWRTSAGVSATRAEIALATDDTRFDLAATSIEADTVAPDIQNKTIAGEVHALRWNVGVAAPAYHSVTFTDLAADTLYAYRVMGAEGHWSEWLQTRTAPAGPAPFRFLYFGDAQEGILSHWARVVRAAFVNAPDARFAIHAGDLVNWGSRDFEWAEWFHSTGFIHGMIPAVPVVGNHEYFDGITAPGGGQVTELSVLWRPQFTLPLEPSLPAELQETAYSFEYGNALIVVLDTMAEAHLDAQAAWLDKTLAASQSTWKIVTMHHPLFELLERAISGAGENGPERRAALLPILAKHGVDLVLQGHDHSYGRGVTLKPPRTPNASRRTELDTVFVTSSSGAKMYNAADGGWDEFAQHNAVLQRTAENTPFFHVIATNGDSLTYEARTASGLLYDAFRLIKPRTGPNRMEQLPNDFAEPRSFDNTGPYQGDRLDTVPPRPTP